MQEGHLRTVPAEMQFGHAAGAENPVGGIEQHPHFGHLHQGDAEVGVLPARVNL